MRHRYRLALVIALASSSRGALAQAVSPAPDGEGPPVVETVGTGERRVTPDRATVMLFVESRASSASLAAAANARAVADVRDTLAKLGLDSTATTAASYHVGPEYEAPEPMERGTRPRQRGYVARTAIRVELRRLDQVGRAIDAGLRRGASGVEGVHFAASTAEEAHRAALAEAAQAARRDAEALARSLGGTLGPVLSVSTAGAGDPRRLNVMMRGPMGYGGAGTSVTPTEIVVAAGVVVRWRFQPGRP